MKKLFVLPIAWISLAGVADAQVGIHNDGSSQFAANGWQVTCQATLLSKLEPRPRALSYHRKYYCSKLGEDKGRLIWEETHSSSSSLHLLNIMPDGTVLAMTYSNRWYVNGPNDPPGKRGDGTQLVLPGHKVEVAIAHATKSGLLVFPYMNNVPLPTYFVPLDGRKPLIDKRVELVERAENSIWRTQTGFIATDDWILWDLTAFNCQTSKRWTLPVDKKASTVLAIDGNLAVVRHEIVVDRAYVTKVITFDLATQKEVSSYPIERTTKLVAHRNGIGYFATEIARKVGDVKQMGNAVALDLSRTDDPLFHKVIPYADRLNAQTLYTRNGFSLPGDPSQVIEWVERAKK